MFVAAGRSSYVFMIKGALQLQYHDRGLDRGPTSYFPAVASALQLHLQMVIKAAPCSDAGFHWMLILVILSFCLLPAGVN